MPDWSLIHAAAEECAPRLLDIVSEYHDHHQEIIHAALRVEVCDLLFKVLTRAKGAERGEPCSGP